MRELVLDVRDHVPHFAPNPGNFAGAGRLPQVHENRGLAGRGIAADEIEAVQLLKLFLDAVGDLLDHVPGGCTGPVGLDYHGLDGEGRVFLAAKLAIGHDARRQGHNHKKPDKGFALERPFGEVEPVHRIVSA